ncbi:MAG: DUF3179 domain-containing protein [Candidatus Wallbacteria bacterium]|nr:DUF3179 domain-containing protein [Candidatus Wallbacteria bacterium]
MQTPSEQSLSSRVRTLLRAAILSLVLVAALLHRFAPGALAVGLDLTDLRVPRAELRGGGPPKDGIPSLTDPAVVSPEQVDFLQEDDWVLGVELGAQARAYPLKLLTQHEAANDVVGGQPIVATY